MERMHAAKECKATSVLNKFKDMEKRIANGEDLDEEKRKSISKGKAVQQLKCLTSHCGIILICI